LKVLFVGLGSIALKHLIAIKKIEPKSELFALRHSKNSSSIEGVENIFSWNHVPKDIDFIIIFCFNYPLRTLTSVWSKLQKHFLSIHNCGGNLHQAQTLPAMPNRHR
jgi:hypothetical protein